MGFKKVGAAPAAPVAAATPAPAPTPAPAKARIRPAAKPATVAPEAETPVVEKTADVTPKPAEVKPKPAGIAPRSGPRAVAPAKVAETATETETPVEDEDPLAWTHSGAEAEAIAAASVQQREEAAEERKKRGYWPQRFELIPPGTQSKHGPIDDRFQADIIILDDQMGPSFYEHVLRNARTGRYDVIEPCPKERDNCPICPPVGDRESTFVSLLSVLNINGYTIKTGPRQGQFIPITKELLVPWASDMLFFAELAKEHGGLRGIQLTMTRPSKSDPRIGKPEFIGKFTDEEIEAYIKGQNMWQPKVTQEGEKLEEEDWLMHPFRYPEFLHRPSGADLRARYSGTSTATGGAPIGAGGGGGADKEWGQSRYAPGAAGQPNGKPPTGFDDLDDDVPF